MPFPLKTPKMMRHNFDIFFYVPNGREGEGVFPEARINVMRLEERKGFCNVSSSSFSNPTTTVDVTTWANSVHRWTSLNHSLSSSVTPAPPRG